MSNAVSSFMGGAGRIGGNLMRGNVGGALGEVGRDIAGAPNWLGSVFSGAGGKTGQPTGGSPGAMGAKLSQSSTAIPNVSGASPTSAPALGGDMNFGGDATERVLRTANGTAPLPAHGVVPSTPMPRAGDVAPNMDLGGLAGAEKLMAKPGETGAEGFDLSQFLQRNAIPAALIGYSVYRGNQPLPGQENMEARAGAADDRANALARGASEAMQGRLPGGAEAGIQQGLQSAQAAIRSRYADMGLTGSTMEGQDLANAEQQAVAMRFQIGQEMARTGLAAAGNSEALASNLYALIMQGMVAQGTQMGDALSDFAGAMTN